MKPTALTDLNRAHKAFMAQLDNIKNDIIHYVSNIESNKDITIISKKPRMFTIRKSKLITDKSFAPSYYDFEYQAKVVAESISGCKDYDTIIKTITDIITNKRVKVYSNLCIVDNIANKEMKYNNRYIELHPNVVTYLSTLL